MKKHKVAIGYEFIDEAWGGGNSFVKSLVKYLIKNNYVVVDALDDDDIDIILLIDPRKRSPNVTFTASDILTYLSKVNNNSIVVHRVNECDERKKTRHMNRLLSIANYCADYTVFVGSWLTNLKTWSKLPPDRYQVITNGSDPALFNSIKYNKWDGAEPLRLVTHHWGGNWMKGFDIYKHIDNNLNEEQWVRKIEFTYIGNVPDKFKFVNTRYVEPLYGEALVKELSKHHVYLTASINEPGGNHQNEGALCGLPLLYRNSGSHPEYCDGFGVMFDEKNIDSKINEMIDTYECYVPLMRKYPHTSDRTCEKYGELFSHLIRNRETIISDRNFMRNPLLYILNQIIPI